MQGPQPNATIQGTYTTLTWLRRQDSTSGTASWQRLHSTLGPENTHTQRPAWSVGCRPRGWRWRRSGWGTARDLGA